MFYFLSFLKDEIFVFNVLKYITFRASFAAITSMFLTMFLGPFVIKKLYELKIGQNIRKEECPPLFELHKDKEGTPTMGGLLIVLPVIFSTLLWADLTNTFIWVVLLSTIWFSVTGFFDDYLKLRNKSSKGLSAKQKLLSQIIFSFIIAAYFINNPETAYISTKLYFPFFKNWVLETGVFYTVIIVLVITGSSNAINLTDGLDGLAIGCFVIAMMPITAMAYISGHFKFADYLHIQYIREAGELTVFCSALIGAGMGFLWYNSYPAQVFMGDTGSLALGGVIGTVAVLIKKEIYLLIIGGVFVFEAISVILQVGSYKLRRKRIFKMAPFHHHLEMKGWPETKIVVRLWIISVIFALLGLSTLKLR